MYKDKEKQKEAQRRWVRQKRSKKGSTSQGSTDGSTVCVIPKQLPANYGQPNCECRHCRANASNKTNLTINHGQYKPTSQLGPKEVNRVALPGDADYTGVALGCSGPAPVA